MDAINAISNKTGVTAENFLPSERTGGVTAVFRLVAKNAETLHIMNDSAPNVAVELLNADWTDTGGTMSTNFRTSAGTSGAGVFGTDNLTVIGGITLTSDKPVNFVPDATLDQFGDPSGFFRPDRTFSKITLDSVSSQSASSASKSLRIFDGAISQVSSARANLGAVQSRFESIVSNLSTSSENLSASKSRIMDADFALETAQLSRTQILQQAGTAMLAQANQQPQLVLQLLK
jgi:flagellin